MNARDRLSAIAARAEAATPGPWEVYDMGDEVYTSENKRGWWWVWRAGEKFYAGVMEVDHSLDPAIDAYLDAARIARGGAS